MPINPKYQAIFEEGKFYHVYNRTLGNQLLFINQHNYIYFLQKFKFYMSDYLDVYAWCLLPNHFHFLIRIKENNTFNQYSDISILYQTIIKQFKNFFISYSQAFKKEQQVKTNIFAPKFKRILITKDSYFNEVIRYIHLNPFLHKIDEKWETYIWSSYRRIINVAKSDLKVKEIIEWFGEKKYL